MTTHRTSPLVSFFVKSFLVVAAALFLASPANAFGPPQVIVGYNPQNTQNIQGDQPLHFQYDLTITAPGVTLAGPLAIGFNVAVLSAPSGVSAETAAGYVTFSQPILQIPGPNASIVVTVYLDAPVGSETGDFSYKLTTTGWPSGLGIVDSGTFINMHVDPPSGLQPPTVTITSPANGTTYTHTAGGSPVAVPVYISGVASQSAPVLTLEGTLSAVDGNGTPFISDVPISLNLTSLGSPSATGEANLPVTAPGVYTISATATNSVGSSVTSVDFIVNEYVPPPTVTINPPVNNPTYTYVRGLTSATVSYAFQGVSQLGGVRSLSATLDGVPITTATVVGVGGPGIGQLVATGTGSLVFDANSVNAVGQHTIEATVVDDNGTSSASATFVVAEQIPTISTAIGHPADGAVFYLPADASALNIAYDFTSSTTYNAPVTAIMATLAKDTDPATSVTIGSTVGLNSATATGSGSLLNVQPGSYALVATGSNAALGLEATDTNLFTVVMPPPPVISFTQPPASTYTALTGSTLSIPIAISTTHTNPATGANIVSQSLTLDDQAVTNLVSSNLNTLTATGTVTLSVPATAAGTTTHTLVASGVDAYGRPATTSLTFDVTVNDPVITIAINSPANNSVYTLPGSGVLTIPFTFTGDITSGATVDSITGNLGGTTNVTILSTIGLGTSNHATAAGTLSITAPGTYTLTATDTNTSSGLSATTSVKFTVNQSQTLPLLTVGITVAPSATYTLPCGCSPLCIPITFVGKSTGGTVSTMTATLDGIPVSLSSLWGIGTSTATAKANLSVRTVGTHLLVVKDTDPFGQTATTSVSFTVVAQSPVVSVVINSPANNAVYTLPGGSSGYSGGCGTGWSSSGSVSIPFSFSSSITAGATIDALSASLNGSAVYVTKSGLGTANAAGTGTLTVSNAGTYTLSVRATDNNCPVSGTKSVTFTVRKANPPAVTISQPIQTTYTSYCGCAGLSIPFSFTGVSESGGISSLSAVLDGRYLNVTTAGVGSLTATGTGTLSVHSTGSHKLTVTAKDPNGTVSTSFSFTVTSQNPTPTVTISAPTSGAVFSYDEGSATPRIPYAITAQTNAGASIGSLKATLNGCAISLSNSGIGSSLATASGTLSVSGPGTYTFTATTTSGCVNASKSVTFTVKKIAVPVCSVDWRGSVCDGKAKRGGRDVSVNCQVKVTNSTGSCTTQRDSSVTFSVYEIRRDGSCGSARIFDSNNYSIDSNNQYCLSLPTSSGSHRYRIEVYSFPAGGSTPKCIGSKEFSTN